MNTREYAVHLNAKLSLRASRIGVLDLIRPPYSDHWSSDLWLVFGPLPVFLNASIPSFTKYQPFLYMYNINNVRMTTPNFLDVQWLLDQWLFHKRLAHSAYAAAIAHVSCLALCACAIPLAQSAVSVLAA